MKTKDILFYSLAAIVVVGFFTVLWILFKVELPQSNHDLALIMLGVLGAKFGDVVAYFFGSSKGSSDKNDLLKNTTP